MANNRLSRPYWTVLTGKYTGLRIPLGFAARRQLAKEIIYRVEAGNGYFGSKEGVIYQHQYKYFVPLSINNPQGEPYRVKFRNAIIAWQGLSEEEKQPWRAKERRIKGKSGYNLYIQNYMRTH